jgi:hypothetical protein
MHELSFGDPRIELRSVFPAMNPALAAGVAAALALAAASVVAQQPPQAPPGAAPSTPSAAAAPLAGSASLGARSVDLAGTDTKYREDVNLDAGVRLFGVQLRYAPRVGESRVDRVELDAYNLGGDPDERLSLEVRKYGAYHLKLNRRRSEYFYDDTILPAALASVSAATGGDFHTFDFERVRTSASLDVDVTPATRVSLGLERQVRTGESSTTLSLERDEFDIAKPLDESLDALAFGVRHAWKRVTLIVDEQARDLENTSELFLPGASPGRNGADAAELRFFRFDRSYDYADRSHGLRMLAEPLTRLDVAAGWRLEELELDFRGEEQARGTGATGAPFDRARAGPGAVGRDIEIADLELGFAATERIRLVGALRRSTLEQDGALAMAPNVGSSDWEIATDGHELGAELAVSPAVSVAAGWSREARTTTYAWLYGAAAAGGDRDTDRRGYFARLKLELAGGLALSASVEDNSIDDPFTLASPTSSLRYDVTVRRRWSNGLSLSGGYRSTDVENDQSDWLADTEQAAVRLMYQRPRLQLSTGYTRIDVARSVEQGVVAGTRITVFAIDYAAASMFRDASAYWRLNDRFSIGGELRSYDNHGSFKLARDDWRAVLDVRLGGDYTLRAAYRSLDYTEDAFDSYDADILELAFGVSW